MRIVLDLQALQTASLYRGIGRYSISLAKNMIAEGKQHEFFIALNHVFSDTIDSLRQDFTDLLPQGNILLFRTPTGVAGIGSSSKWRRHAAELIREHFLEQLQPDCVHVSRLFEVDIDNAVASIGRFADLPTAVTLYDLIPYRNQEHYLANPLVRSWYMNKLTQLRKADLILAISEYTRKEALDILGIPDYRVVNISADADAVFRTLNLSDKEKSKIIVRYGLKPDFVLYTGGIDYRKNMERLIEAYANLPSEIRALHQLVICCQVKEDERRQLLKLASKMGLSDSELVLTGYVNDEDLVMLYNLCKLFVFPSLTEGFGLPVLEAMRCGAPVIGSNNSSIPEVIGLDAALFDPYSTNSIASKLYEALTNKQFRQMLQEHSKVQTTKFSWSASARHTIEAIEEIHNRRKHIRICNIRKSSSTELPKMAYFSPLPPERSGIAAYSTALLPELSRHYKIDLITNLKNVADTTLSVGFRRRTIAEFKRNYHEYNRVLYQMGNSTFHNHMFKLLEKYPGTVVLHDFFLSNIVQYLEITISGSAIFRQVLYQSHGYPALFYWSKNGTDETVWKYPCSLKVLQSAQGIIVHSEHALKLAEQFFELTKGVYIKKIPQLYYCNEQIDRASSRKLLGLAQTVFLVCCFGGLGTTKLNERLLKAWIRSELVLDKNCYLVFVGGERSTYVEALHGNIKAAGIGNHVKITGYVTPEIYRHYLTAADMAVQLRTHSRGETSRSVLDCLANGLATIVNNHGWLAELPDNAVFKIKDEFTDAELANALEQLYNDVKKRETLGQNAIDYVKKHLDPTKIAQQYAEAIESFADYHPIALRQRLLSAIVATSVRAKPSKVDLAEAAIAIAENIHPKGKRNLFVDITVLTMTDLRAGIQRVVISILRQLLIDTPDGYRVEPVYRHNGTYRYARRFTSKLFGLGDFGLDDAPLDVVPRDIFIGLDLDLGIDNSAREWLSYHTQRGMKLYFVIYDLLPILRPDRFPSDFEIIFRAWLKGIISQANGLLCISRAVADELCQWMEHNSVSRILPLNIGYFHLGADMEKSINTSGISTAEEALLSNVTNYKTFLMVGSVGPGKGHVQAVAAFEQLWSEGEDILLAIVGRPSWEKKLANYLHSHKELGNRLIWFENASDELLERLYQKASALLIPSEGEGFGIPIVEAARHRLPVIARDLPVFREVAGDNAFYFSGMESRNLANALKAWLELYRSNEHPTSSGIRWIIWKESTNQLMRLILNSQWNATWEPDRGFRWKSQNEI